MSTLNSTLTGALWMRLRSGIGLVAALGIAGCDMSLDLTNPNAATEETALTNLDGVIATSLGMQDQLAGAVLTYVRAPALVTDEWGTASAALAADQALFTGGEIDPSFGVVSGPYYVTYRVARTADLIVNAVPTLEGVGPELSAGLTANAKLFKAMALGYAAMQYEELPINAAVEGGVPVPRAQVFAEVIRLLESARSDIAGVTDAQLSVFNTRALTPSFSLRNTIEAMLARYNLYAGNNAAADAAAARVDLASVSLFTYPDPDLNPIYNYSVLARYVAPLQSWVDEAEAGDDRVAFWVDVDGTRPAGNPPTVLLRPFERYSVRNSSFPVYLPGEMLLIRAEVAARAGDLVAARGFINEVRTKGATANSPGATLPPITALTHPTQNSILAQIAYERRYELFSQGLRWEDLRRLGQYTGDAPKSDFLPLPDSECANNPNAGC